MGGPNEVWAMDFMSDQLFDGRPFRILTVVDCHTREALSTVPRVSFRAYQVVEALDELVRVRGRPKSLRVDNGPEFAGRALDQWAYLNGVELDFSRPGKPTERARVRHRSEDRGERLHRSVQRPPASRVPECVLISIHGRRPRSSRTLEKGVQ